MSQKGTMSPLEEQIALTLQRIEADLSLLHSQRQEAKAQNIRFPPTQYNLIGDTLCGFAALLEARPQLKELCACLGLGGEEQACIARCSQPAPEK